MRGDFPHNFDRPHRAESFHWEQETRTCRGHPWATDAVNLGGRPARTQGGHNFGPVQVA
jgi:hypothetical protein